MKAVLLRIGIDTGCGGIHGPLFKEEEKGSGAFSVSAEEEKGSGFIWDV